MSRLQVQSHSLVLLEGLGDLIGALRRGRGHCYVVRTCSRVQHAQGDTDKDQQTNSQADNHNPFHSLWISQHARPLKAGPMCSIP